MKTKIRFWMPAILFALSSVFLTNCKEDATIPVVSTNEVTKITDTKATSGGNISSDGGATVTERGVCWSTSQTPTITDNKTTDGTGTGSFTSAITGLTANKTYYVRAYATNSAGTAYGSAKSFITLEGNSGNIVFNPNITYGIMTDIDGNTYKTVTIGTQTWMAENLRVTKYNDGTNIPNVTGGNAWSVLTTGAYCNYDNDPSNVATYGRLYNWHAVNTGKLCPTGWHVPTDEEWWTLADYLGDQSVIGGKLKETGTTHWQSSSEGTTNETGFTALPGGLRSFNGTFDHIGNDGYWWSTNEHLGYCGKVWLMYHDYSGFYGSYFEKLGGLSVRCVKD